MGSWIPVILLMLVFAVVWAIAVPMFAIGGLRPSELRDRLVGYALRTYTWHGEAIPGLKRGRVASFVLWALRYDGADAPRIGDRRAARDLKFAEEHAESHWTRSPTDKYVPS
jgi:hypothetical protein